MSFVVFHRAHPACTPKGRKETDGANRLVGWPQIRGGLPEDVVAVGVGETDVGEADDGVDDGEADERWLGDADAVGGWEACADADADALAGWDVPWDDDDAALAEEDVFWAAAEEADAGAGTPAAPRPAEVDAGAEEVSPAGD